MGYDGFSVVLTFHHHLEWGSSSRDAATPKTQNTKGKKNTRSNLSLFPLNSHLSSTACFVTCLNKMLHLSLSPHSTIRPVNLEIRSNTLLCMARRRTLPSAVQPRQGMHVCTVLQLHCALRCTYLHVRHHACSAEPSNQLQPSFPQPSALLLAVVTRHSLHACFAYCSLHGRKGIRLRSWLASGERSSVPFIGTYLPAGQSASVHTWGDTLRIRALGWLVAKQRGVVRCVYK